MMLVLHVGILLLYAATTIATVPAEMPPKDQRITSYACENSFITLRCAGEGERIRILRANYGRFSLVICNQKGILLGWNLNCVSLNSTDIVEARCSNKQNCTVYANNKEFGDPCPNTKKYIEIRYYCEKGHVEGNETSITTTTETVDETTVTASSGLSTDSVITEKSENVTSTELPVTSPVYVTSPVSVTSPISVTMETTETTEITESDIMCSTVEMDGVIWHQATAGTSVQNKCPTQLSGVSIWQCGLDGNWVGEPDVLNCVSPWMEEIQTMLSMKGDLVNTMKSLNTRIQSSRLVAGDLKTASLNLLPTMVDRVRLELSPDMPLQIKREKVHGFSKELVKSGSSLLHANQRASWESLDVHLREKSATSLIVTMEKMASELAATIDTEDTVTATEENIVLEVSVLNAASHPSVKLPREYSGDRSGNMEPHFTLPLDGISSLQTQDNVAVTYLFYNNLDWLMDPALSVNTSDEEASKRVINSNVISASVTKHQRAPTTIRDTFIQLSKPMTYTVPLKNIYSDKQPVCAFWMYNHSTLTGDWSSEGCRVVFTTDEYTTCECNHLTNFAVLMDVAGTKLHRLHVMSLQAITYVGCSVSIICLAMSLISFSIFRNLQSDRNTIHKNLALCLMIAETLFLFGIGQTSDKIVCSVIAGFLHFFFLASFCWMCLEGIQLYFMLIVVFEAERYKWFYLFGYGVPAVIVAVSAAIDHTGYGTQTHCWLQTDNNFILSFVIPAAIVIMINFVMLSVALYTMCRHAGVTARKKGKLERMGTWLKGSAVLVVLLGLTWTFGLMYVNEDTVVLAYLFTILNSLQGLFIFVFHCFMDKKVKKEWRRAIYKTKWLPMCCRVNIGTTSDTATSPTPSYSSGIQNYFLRLWSSRRKRRSTSSTTAKNRRSDLDSFLHTESSSGCTTGTAGKRYSNPSDKLLPPSQNVYTAMPTHYEGQPSADLSVIDCSVVDSENLTEYCRQNLNVSNEPRRYSSSSDEDVTDNLSEGRKSPHRLSFLSTDSNLKEGNECFTDNDEADNKYAVLDFTEPTVIRKPKTSETDQNLINNILDLYENTKHSKIEESKESKEPKSDILNSEIDKNVDINTDNKVITFTRSVPNLKNCEDEYSSLDTSTQPLLGSLPDVSVPSNEKTSH